MLRMVMAIVMKAVMLPMMAVVAMQVASIRVVQRQAVIRGMEKCKVNLLSDLLRNIECEELSSCSIVLCVWELKHPHTAM